MAEETKSAETKPAETAEKAPKTIKVRLLADYAGYACNSVQELPAAEAKGIIEAGYGDADKAAIAAALKAAEGTDREADKLQSAAAPATAE